MTIASESMALPGEKAESMGARLRAEPFRIFFPLGLLFGWLLLGEHVSPTDLIGIVPVAIGIYLVTHPAPTRTFLPSQGAKLATR